MNHKKWHLLPPVPPSHLDRWQNVSPLIVQLLYNRGITSPVQVESFLAADERLLGDPFLLPGMNEAVARINRALLTRESIAIYGDFDTDGVTATALLTEAILMLGGKVVPYIPHRLEEGYGLNHGALESLYNLGITLVITVDCGISSIDEVSRARERGLDIIITDHHSVPAIMPPALAVVNPKRADSAYPFSELAGVGVAFKLLQALLRATGRELDEDRFLELVALGTVADLVRLLGENRYLVKCGLEVLNHTNRIGLQEMILHAGLTMGNIDTETISYGLGPRLNAAGRLDNAIISYNLLVTSSPNEAQELAALLETKNAERQRLTVEVLAKAKEKLLPISPDLPLLMVGGEDYPAGVVGVVASRLAEEFYRPALVLTLGQEVSRGSARSIPEFNIIAALRECHTLLSQYGGHVQAAGFTLPSENIAPLRERLLKIAASQLASIDLRPTLAIDAEIPLSFLGKENLQLMGQLPPFGRGNPPPTFLSRRVRVADCRQVGSNGDHLKLKLRDGNITWDAIGFKLGSLINHISPRLDIVYSVRIEDWGGTELLQLNVLDLAPAG